MKRDFKSNLDSSENNDNHEDENLAGAEEHLIKSTENASDPGNWKITSNDSKVIQIIK